MESPGERRHGVWMSGQGKEARSAGEPNAWPGADEAAFVARLRSGEEPAFAMLVEHLHGRLLALARSFCSRPELAEEAVQETWLAVIKGLGGYEARGSLRSWIFGILVNRARTLAVREKRHTGLVRVELPADPGEDAADREPGMGASGRWETPPVPWGLEDPETAILSRECLAVVEGALERLPEAQRTAVLLRDVDGLESAEACNILGVSETNLRVLLHRGRSAIRRALDAYVRDSRIASGRSGPRKGPGV